MQDVFDFQVKLQEKLYGIQLPSKQDGFIQRYAFGVFTELGEALAINKNWKDWRQGVDYDEKELFEEIADIWICLVNYTLANGMNFEDVLAQIKMKQDKLSDRVWSVKDSGQEQ